MIKLTRYWTPRGIGEAERLGYLAKKNKYGMLLDLKDVPEGYGIAILDKDKNFVEWVYRCFIWKSKDK